MKRHLLLSYENFDLMEESERHIQGHKEEIEIFLSYQETEDNLRLKTLQRKEEDYKNQLIKIKKDREILQEELNNKDFEELERFKKDIKVLENRMENILYELGIKDEKNIKNFDLKSGDNFELVKNYKKFKNEKTILEEEYLTEKEKIIKRMNEKIFELIELEDEIKKALQKNYEEQEILIEKLNKVKSKTTEELYMELLSSTRYFKEFDTEIQDDGKFYAYTQHYIMFNNGTTWFANGKAKTEFDNVEDLMKYLKISPEKNIQAISIQAHSRNQKIMTMLNNNSYVKEMREIETFKEDLIKERKIINSIHEEALKIEEILIKKEQEFKEKEKQSKTVLSKVANTLKNVYTESISTIENIKNESKKALNHFFGDFFDSKKEKEEKIKKDKKDKKNNWNFWSKK
jgi:hypothetical protein